MTGGAELYWEPCGNAQIELMFGFSVTIIDNLITGDFEISSQSCP